MRPHLILLCLCFTTFACENETPPAGDAKTAAGATPSATTTTSATAEAVSGPAELSKARMNEVTKKVTPFQPWAEAYKTTTAMLGKETAVDGDMYYWAVVDGSKCAKYEMAKKDDQVGTNGVVEVDAMMKSMFAKCAAHAKK